MIKDYNDYDEFTKSGKSKIHLFTTLYLYKINDKELDFFDFEYDGNTIVNIDKPKPNEFLKTRTLLKYKLKFWRIVTSLFFILGITLLFIVTIQKVHFTLNYIFT